MIKAIKEQMINGDKEEQVICNHCGDTCPSTLFSLEEKNFCCAGCRTVYQVLSENNLNDFYKIEKLPGVSQKGKKAKRYDWLDETEIISQLVDYQDETQTRVTVNLPQIHCSSCVWLLENLTKLDNNILASKVNFMKREAYITYSHTNFSLRQLAELLSKIGYAPDIGSAQLKKSVKPEIDRTLIYQIGLAGFAFGNIMLFSFPEYFGLEYGEDTIFRRLFGWLNLALAIPVLLYSARDYLRSAYHGIKQRKLNIDVPVSLGIITLFTRSAYDIISQTGAGYFDSLAGLVFFLLIGKWFQRRTFSHLTFDRDYESYFPVAATVLKDGEEKSISLPKLNVGDRLLIRHEELIPADGILCSEKADIDYSFVTGEAEPIRKGENDLLYAGGRQTEGAFEMLVTKKPSQSYLIRLWNDDIFEQKTSRTMLLADKVGKYFTLAILLIAFLTFGLWIWMGDINTAVNAFTAVLIIACPCAIALAVPFTFGTASQLIARRKLYLKDISVIEKLNDVDTIVFDKTGTITSPESSTIEYTGIALNESIIEALQALSRQSGHPLSRKVREWASEQQASTKSVSIYDFSEEIGQGISGESQGLKIKLGNRAFTNAENISKEHDYARVFLSINGDFYGSFSLSGNYRNGLVTVMDWAKKKGEVYLLSGDNEREKSQLSPLFGEENLYFSHSPHDKLDFIKKLQSKGKNVLMFGDGLNDAGALRQSDVGIVITENTNNFVPACDAITDASNFSQLPAFFHYCQQTVKVVYLAYVLALCYNIIGLSYAVTGTLSPVVAAILMPLSSISVVLFGVLSSRFLYQINIERSLKNTPERPDMR